VLAGFQRAPRQVSVRRRPRGDDDQICVRIINNFIRARSAEAKSVLLADGASGNAGRGGN
jgi:hypothetical protein